MKTRILDVLLALALVSAAGGRALAAPPQVVDLEPGPDSSGPVELTAFDDAVFFNALTAATWATWRTDGTLPGTTVFNPPVFGTEFTAIGNRLYYTGDDDLHNSELWVSDGVTSVVLDILPGPEGSHPRSPTRVGNVVFFDAFDASFGRALYKTDGTPAGTVLVRTVAPPESNFRFRQLTAAGGLLFFVADDGVHGRQLWRSDGTDAGTFMLDIAPGQFSPQPDNLIEYGGALYFAASDPVNGGELWKSDGTPAGTAIVKDINPGGEHSGPEDLTVLNGRLYFAAHEPAHGFELWRSDGTAAGTELVADILPGPDSGSPQWITAAGGHLTFAATDPVHGRELWRSDGTAAGTVLVADINPGPADSEIQAIGDRPEFPALPKFASVGPMVFFMADDGGSGLEPWRSDGTAAGTALVADMNPGPATSDPDWITALGDRILFVATEPATGRELWTYRLDADLSLSLVASAVDPPVGSDVTLAVTAANAGPLDATGVGVRVTLPPNLDLQSVVGGPYDPATGLWSPGGLASGASALLTLVARVTDSTPATVVAEVMTSNQPDPDSTPGNGAPAEDDHASAHLIPRDVADLSLALAADTLDPVAGTNVTLTAAVANAGPAAATGVQARLPLPAGLVFVSATPAASYDPATGAWTIGMVAAGGMSALAVVATVNTLVPVDVTAEVMAAGTFDPDSTPGNGAPGEDDLASLRLVPRSGGIVVNHPGAQIVATDGFCTLREAIIAANTDTMSGPVFGECAAGNGADVIEMRANPAVHTHTAVDNVVAGVGSALPAVTTPITIDGRGAVIARSTAAGIPAMRLFTVMAGGSLTLRDATVTGGRAGTCGAIANLGTLVLARATVAGNTAIGGPGAGQAAGGGLCNLGGTLALGDTTVVRNNLASHAVSAVGGGVYIRGGTTTLADSEVRANDAVSSSFAGGGGIRVEQGAELSLTDSRILDNVVTEQTASGNGKFAIGGGLCAAHSVTLAITGGLVSGNRVTGGSMTGQPAGGGGLYVSTGAATLTDVTVRENRAVVGGGALLVQGAALTMTGGTIGANVATGGGVPFANGGGLANGSEAQRPGAAALTGVSIRDNRTLNGGGAGISTYGPLTLVQSIVTGNVAAAGWGGGLLDASGQPVRVEGSVFSQNSALAGAGLFKFDFLGAALTLDGSTVTDNTASIVGGGIGALGAPAASVRLRNNTSVAGNVATAEDGGGLWLDNVGLLIEDATIAANEGGRDGGGLWMRLGAPSTITRSVVRANRATGAGGGVFVGDGARLDLAQSLLEQNTARIWAGVANWGETTLTQSSVRANETTFFGGGGIGNGRTLRLVGGEVSDNRTGPTGNGGGIEQFAGATLTLDGTLVARNRASLAGGGVALIFGPSSLTVTGNSTIRDNVAEGIGGGGIYLESGAGAVVAASSVQDNAAPNGQGGGIFNNSHQGSLQVSGGQILRNTSWFWAGIANRGTATIADSNVLANVTTVGGGGGLGNARFMLVVRSFVTGNRTAPGGHGGGIEQFDGGEMHIHASSVSENTAGLGGGGIALYQGRSEMFVQASSIFANSAAGPQGGGGIYAPDRAVVTVRYSVLHSNETVGSGGGLHAGGRTRVESSTFWANSAASGGGVHAAAGSDFVALNSTFSGNVASGEGGAIRVVSAAPRPTVRVSYCTIVANDAGVGGGLHVHDRARVEDTIVAGNLQGGMLGGPNADCLGGRVENGRNLVGAGAGCDAAGNLTIAPADVFVTALGPLDPNARHTHAPLAGSPVVDASTATCNAWIRGLDQLGVARPRDGNGDGVFACDIGSIER
jgi:uncharacterized repeat protein (TIGR01451 family)